MTMFLSSTYPSSRRPCRNASMRSDSTEGEVAPSKPIRGIFAGCCASAETQSAMIAAQNDRTEIFLFGFFTPYSLPFTPHLLDYFVRSRQNIRWNGQADLLGG